MNYESIKIDGLVVHNVPKPAAALIEGLHDRIDTLRASVERQMVIALKCGNLMRSKLPDVNEKNWHSFLCYFPAFVAIGGMPQFTKLGSIIQDWFGLSSVAYREHTYTLRQNYSWKTFRVSPASECGNPDTYTLIVDPDPLVTLKHICEALVHIGYDFGIRDPFAAYQEIAYSKKEVTI